MLFKKLCSASKGRVIAVVSLIIILGFFVQSSAQQITPEMVSDLQYRYIGPGGNRTSAVAGVPGDPMVYYIGASSGGVWKSVDGGLNWRPIFDCEEGSLIFRLLIPCLRIII